MEGQALKDSDFYEQFQSYTPTHLPIVTTSGELFLPIEPIKKPDEIFLNVILDSGTENKNLTSGQSSWIIYTNCILTRILFCPCLLTMVISSVLLIYLTRKYLRDGTILYFSVIVYSLSQILMFAVIVMDIILSSWSLSSLVFCKIRAISEIFVIVVSAYSILVMTGVRFIFIHRPLRYRSILKLRYQVVVEVLVLILAASLTLSPVMFGLCDLEVEEEKFCHFQIGTGSCMIFQTLCVGLGIVLPVLATTLLYGLIYRTILRLKSEQKLLMPSKRRGSKLKTERSESQDTARSRTQSSVLSDNTKSGSSSSNPNPEDGDMTAVVTRIGRLSGVFDLDGEEEKEEEGREEKREMSSITNIAALIKSNTSGGKRVLMKGVSHTSNLVRNISRKRLVSLRNMAKETFQVPWSIVAVLVLYIITTTPWIALIVAPQLWYQAISGQLRLLLDLKYSVMFLGIACSPIATIVTTKALRKSFWMFVYSFRRA